MAPRAERGLARRGWGGPVAFTLAFNTLIAFAVGGMSGTFTALSLVTAVAALAFCRATFPGSRILGIELGTFVGVYTCIFTFFHETNFGGVDVVALHVGYVLPMLSFFVGIWQRRELVRRIAHVEMDADPRSVAAMMRWLVPVFAIGGATFLVPDLSPTPALADALFLAAMAAISTIVYLVSPQVAGFLVETALLFEEFYVHVAELLVPAFAFLVFYAFQVIVFACVYRLISLHAVGTHFVLLGHPHRLTFSESLYFSVVTLSSVGYGDMAPASNAVRILVSIQIMLGVLLILFGVNEIIVRAREWRRQRHAPRGDE